MKLPNLQAYRPEQTELCERALVTAWGLLDDYVADLVLIGGLVPRYLCLRDSAIPDVSTLDVDLALALGVRGVSHNRIMNRLESAHFKPEPDTRPMSPPVARFFRSFPEHNFKLQIEFLTDKPTPESSSAPMLDNMIVPAQPGIGRALAIHRTVSLTATDLFGALTTRSLNVCEIGPFLCLKLRACGADSPDRNGKDAFDVVHAVQYYDRGLESALAGFAAERGINPAFDEALAVLERKFADADGAGPGEYAEFSMGGLRMTANLDDFDVTYQQHRETAAFIADRLRRAANNGTKTTKA